MDNNIGSVLVVGAGVGGIRSALDLAEMGYKVYLTDNSPYVGGILLQLDNQFPSNHCGMCKMLPLIGRDYASQFCMRKALFHDNIEILPFTDIEAVDGEPGNFEVSIFKKARQVNVDICTGCGKCVEVCPVEVKDEFNQGLTTRKAVYQPVPHNLPNTYIIDQNHCNKCGDCMVECPVRAIDLFVIGKRQTLNVGAIILAAGTALYDPSELEDRYRYPNHPNVITGLQFERLISGTGLGKSDGKIRRPSDGKEAKRIAWLQCVGSRDKEHGYDYCSSICCMFALKEAVLAKEFAGDDVDTAIFYMDMRTFGKDFYRYQKQCEEEFGVRLVRSKIHSIEDSSEDPGTMMLRYITSDREIKREEFDLVVLSTGQSLPKGMDKLVDITGIEVNEFGYAKPQELSQARSSVEGIYLSGSFCGFKDISESLTQASSASMQASMMLKSKGLSWQRDEEQPEERKVSTQEAKIALVLCKGQGTCSANLDFTELKKKLKDRRGVFEIIEIDELCSDEGLSGTEALLEESGANRVLMGACLPYVYRQKLRTLAPRLGLNPALLDIVDLKGVAVTSGNGNTAEAALNKATMLLTGAIQKLKAQDPFSISMTPVTHKALVIGGGIAGMRSALSLAELGNEVFLVEKSDRMGGHARKIHYTLLDEDIQKYLRQTIEAVESNELIKVYKNSEVVESYGSVGNFVSVIKSGDADPIKVQHGVTIVATGGRERDVGEYKYGENDRILTQQELEENLTEVKYKADELKHIVMIQCVGSRDKDHPYCSRVCCQAAIKNAFKIKEKNKKAKIFVLYRDMMTYGFMEQYFSQARKAGIKFVMYEPDNKPRVEIKDEKPVVTFYEPILQRDVEVDADLLVLSTGISPGENDKLSEAIGLPLTEDGFFCEAESKFRPVDFLKEGVFVCGLAHSPRSLDESIAQAEAAAQRAMSILAKDHLYSSRMVAKVKQSICSQCQTCIEVCPYDARILDEDGKISVNEALCQGCGACQAACPNGASYIEGWSDKQTINLIDACLEDLAFNLP